MGKSATTSQITLIIFHDNKYAAESETKKKIIEHAKHKFIKSPWQLREKGKGIEQNGLGQDLNRRRFTKRGQLI